MNEWAEVDSWRRGKEFEVIRSSDAQIARVAADRLRDGRQAKWTNLLKRFRELPGELAHASLDGSASDPAVQVAMDWLEDQGLGPGAPARWYPMSAADRAMVVALGTVRIPPATPAKRFRKSLLAQLELRAPLTAHLDPQAPLAPHAPLITSAQGVTLRKLIHTFRRQIRPELLPFEARWLLKNPPKSRSQQ